MAAAAVVVAVAVVAAVVVQERVLQAVEQSKVDKPLAMQAIGLIPLLIKVSKGRAVHPCEEEVAGGSRGVFKKGHLPVPVYISSI